MPIVCEGKHYYYVGIAPSMKFWHARSGTIQVLSIDDQLFEDELCSTDQYDGAHNMCICQSLSTAGEIYAVGGIKKGGKGGIALYRLDLLERRWVISTRLVYPSHPGGIERRSAACFLGNTGMQLDGLSCLTKFRGEWFLFARSNIGADGRRYVQVCKGPNLDSLGPFQLVHINHYDVSNDVYVFHTYDLGDVMLAITPVSIGKGGGIYACTSTDGISFSRLLLLMPCESHAGRTSHMPIYGLEIKGEELRFYIQENIASRVKTTEPEIIRAYEMKRSDVLELR